MLKAVVPKPELKYKNISNDAQVGISGSMAVIVNFRDTFAIPQNTGLSGRVGDSVWCKMVELDFSLEANPAATRTATITAAGLAGTGNIINQALLDQAARLFIIQTRMDKTTSNPVSGLEWMGSTQSNAPGGASDWHLTPDRLVYKGQKRHIYHDNKYYLGRGIETTGDVGTPSTGAAPFGYSTPLYTVGEHRIVLKFPGHGLKLQFDSNATSVPVQQPLLYVCGKNNAQGNNPFFRLKNCRVWYTDP